MPKLDKLIYAITFSMGFPPPLVLFSGQRTTLAQYPANILFLSPTVILGMWQSKGSGTKVAFNSFLGGVQL